MDETFDEYITRQIDQLRLDGQTAYNFRLGADYANIYYDRLGHVII